MALPDRRVDQLEAGRPTLGTSVDLADEIRLERQLVGVPEEIGRLVSREAEVVCSQAARSAVGFQSTGVHRWRRSARDQNAEVARGEFEDARKDRVDVLGLVNQVEVVEDQQRLFGVECWQVSDQRVEDGWKRDVRGRNLGGERS